MGHVLGHTARTLGLLCSLALSGQVQAFKPTAEHGHAGVTKEGMMDISVVDSSGQTLKFSDKAIKEVRKANADTDSFGAGGGGWKPYVHCDDELLPECSKRVVDLKEKIIEALLQKPPNGPLARKYTGTALHTLQDFYSHSNWSLLHGSSKNSDFGRVVLPRPPKGLDLCLRGFGFQGAGYYNADGNRTLTSGYFTALGALDSPEGKCHHGLTELMPYTNRMSKDWPKADYTSQASHSQAREAAIASTQDFVEQVLSAPGVKANDEATRAYMDVNGSYGFAIDNTGSMGSVINGVKSSVSSIVNAVASSQTKPDKYVLATFNDPGVSNAFVTTDASALLTRVHAIYPRGGGDCPEMSMKGIETVVDSASPGSSVLMFTDASSKDRSLWPVVSAKAKKKNIKISTVASGSCSPIDPAYYALATETGGQLIETYRSSSETEKIFDIIKPGLTKNLATVFVAKGFLANGASKSYEVDVDSSTKTLVLTVSSSQLSSSAIQLIDPEDRVVSSADVSVSITQVKGSRIFTIQEPAVGRWALNMASAGNYFVSIDAVSDVEFNEFQFVEVAGRAGHTGYFPIQGEPIIGSVASSVSTVFGDLTDPRLIMLSESGEVIQEVAFSSGEVMDDEYFAFITLPLERFRPMVKGVNNKGEIVMRSFSSSFIGRSVKVEALSAGFAAVEAGTTYSQRFEITNIGAADVYGLSATATLSVVKGISDSNVSLGENESKVVEVFLEVPITAIEGESDTVAFLARGKVSDNSSVITTIVTPERVFGDIDGDGDVDIDDINLIIGVKNMPSSGSSDIRDIDKNGVVDVIDARRLARMCSRHKCVREY